MYCRVYEKYFQIVWKVSVENLEIKSKDYWDPQLLHHSKIWTAFHCNGRNIDRSENYNK